MTKIFIDPKFQFHPEYKQIYMKVKEAVKRFPEIKEIGISSFKAKKGSEIKEEIAARTLIRVDTPIIYFNVCYSPSSNTIYHELQHIIHGMEKGKNLKTHKEELEATLMGLGRMPENAVETRAMPYLGNVPKNKIPSYGKFAANEKAKGNKKWFEATIDKMAQDAENEKYKNGWAGKEVKDKIIKSDKQGMSRPELSKFLKTNIKKKEQLDTVKEMIQPKKGNWLYEQKDLIKVPTWMKNSKNKK